MAKLTRDDIAEIRSGVQSGIPQKFFCDKFAISDGYIGDIIRGKKWNYPDVGVAPLTDSFVCKGEKHGRSKLKEIEVVRIKEMISEGIRHLDIANEFGVSRATVSLIASGKIWSHVSTPLRR